MASPQKENGYTAIADEIMDALIQYRIPGEQMQCTLFIIRKTYGYNKTWDNISSSQFVKATGMNKGNVGRAIRALIDKKIVVKKDNKHIPSYRFNKDYNKWKSLSKKTTVVKKDNRALSKKTPTIDITTIDNDPDHPFHKFYKIYPKKKSVGQAKKAWLKLEKKNQLPSLDIILSAVEKQKVDDDWKKNKGKFIPHPATWLNAQKWEDEVQTNQNKIITGKEAIEWKGS